MSNKYKDQLNGPTPNTLADLFKKLGLGSFFQAASGRLWKAVPAASASQLATLEAIALPDGAKAASIKRAYSRSATAGAGELTVAAANATPTTGQIAVAPNGDIVVLAADAHLLVDVEYEPLLGDVVEMTLPVASDSLTIPSKYTACVLLECTSTAGTLTGALKVLAPSGSAPATTQARLNLAKTAVTFAAADAVTMATVKLLVAPSTNTHALMETTADF